MTQFMQKFSENVVKIFFTFIIGVLTLLSIIGTCYIDIGERMHYTYINVIDFISFLVIFSLIFFLFWKFKDKLEAMIKLPYLLGLSFALGVLFILVAQFVPRADQQLCMIFAQQMHEGDFSAFNPKGYMQIYPQQCGLVLFYYVIGFLVGTDNVIFIQFLNVLAYTAFIYCIHSLTKKLFKSETLANYVALFTILFIPLLFFTSFVYGTMLGLAASTYAILKAMDYMEKRRIRDCILCALSAGFSLVVRKNYIIVVVAIIVVLFLHAIIRSHKRAFLCIVVIAASYVCFTKAPVKITEQITGQQMESGLPSIAWLTMGLQDGGHRANGWYNSYSLNTFQDNDYDVELTKKIAKRDLKKALLDFAKHPDYAVSFFTGKIASEWNEPTFQIFYINDVSDVTEENSPFVYNLIQGVGHPFLLKYFDFLITFIYLGVFLYIVHLRKDMKIWDMIPIIAFIGGFLFHLGWEAKGQYTLSYFVLLFPYCFKGYSKAYYTFLAGYKKRKSLDKKQTCRVFLPLLLVTVVFIGYKGVYYAIPSARACVKRSNLDYEKYLTTSTATKYYINGNYRIKNPATDQYITFDNSNDEFAIRATYSSEKRDDQILQVTTTSKEMTLLLKKYNQPLNNVDFKQFETISSKRRINYYCLDNDNRWSILVTADGSFAIKNSLNYALTRTNSDQVIISPFQSSDRTQRWVLEPVTD